MLPLVRRLESEGALQTLQDDKGLAILAPAEPRPEPPPPVEVLDEDFHLLNALERFEERRIAFGVFEGWARPTELLRLAGGAPTEVVDASVQRLEADGWLMRLPDGRVRSRAAELARELRHVKQRFGEADAAKRPYLVRSLRMVLRDRTKPARNKPLGALLGPLRARFAEDATVSRVLDGFERAVRGLWPAPEGKDPALGGFQVRAIDGILRSWLGDGDGHHFVITADTGSGKTEAAAFPLLVGAAIDRARGIAGTRAVLVYPRIRLATNQAQRLVRYAAALSRTTGQHITVGLQHGDVPRHLPPSKAQQGAGWAAAGEDRWAFPLFRCPMPMCGGRLELQAGEGARNTLTCTREGCGWRFKGWIGCKEGLWSDPPAIFICVTESLHQWQMDSRAGALWGDRRGASGGFKPPRALLADEVHLFGLVHGAQTGYAFRRLLARMRLNREEHPIAIGMSATLGEPERIWGDLVGCDVEEVRRFFPEPDECPANPRGREYFYFVQPEVESRGKDVAAVSTTIQSLMCLAHGMRRRTDDQGGFRALAFLDSMDRVKRMNAQYKDAEERLELAALRTARFGADVQSGEVRSRCCGEPATCDRFHDGECWYFAANDPAQQGAGGVRLKGEPLAVAASPIYSANTENADERIAEADVVFATSSLEVGYDDPDLSLVYQQYAPANVASFVQRKGRGGRGADDRPVTGVTLSVYSPRDLYFFRSPDGLLQADEHRVPVNMANVFVRRGQVLSFLLDLAARRVACGRGPARVDEALLREAEPIIAREFGPGVFAEVECSGLGELWARATKDTDNCDRLAPWALRKKLEMVPTVLFESINVPLVAVTPEGWSDPKHEDVSLALSEAAPGRITLRWGRGGTAHWNPLVVGRAPMFAPGRVCFREFYLVPGGDPEATLAALPMAARTELGGGLEPKVVRPTGFQLPAAGRLWGTDWKPEDGTTDPGGEGPLHHESKSRLSGTVVVASEDESPKTERWPALAPWAAEDAAVLLAKPTGGTGLRVSQVFWAAEVEVVLDTLRRDRKHGRQEFTHPNRDVRALWGYGMRPEGIQVRVDMDRVDAFVASEQERLRQQEHELLGDLRTRRIRYEMATGLSCRGLNPYQVGPLGELVAAALALPGGRDRLEPLRDRWDRRRFTDLLAEARQGALLCHPALPDGRWKRLSESLATPAAVRAVREVLGRVDLSDDCDVGDFLKSALLHGLALRLKQEFVIHGMGEERGVIAHVRLPVQYGDADGVITVCERGSGGDGTARAFIRAAPDIFERWRSDGFVRCENAGGDALVDHACSAVEAHDSWQQLDPGDIETVRRIGRDLGWDADEVPELMQAVMRIVYSTQEVEGERFSALVLRREANRLSGDLRASSGRFPSTWELVSGLVRSAGEAQSSSPRWAALLRAYERIERIAPDGALSPGARLAEQVLRVAAPLCTDGCRGCLHAGSDLMSDLLVELTTSRRLLERFWRSCYSPVATLAD